MNGRSLSRFVHGCNYPWSTDGRRAFYGLDFGSNVWGTHIGVSTRRAAIDADFARMASLGLTLARWFVFCDGRAGIVFDDAGRPTGLDGHMLTDLDTALETASRHGMQLCLVLLDHHWMFRGLPAVVPDPVTGSMVEITLSEGRAAVLLEEFALAALFDRVIGPIVRRYGPAGRRADLSHAVLAWEWMNEPDFVVEEWERDLSSRVERPLPFAALAEQVAWLSRLVHEHSEAATTLAAARVRNLWAWDDDALGLDFLQLHTYPDVLHPLRDEDVYGRSVEELGCRRPVVLGEFPGNAPVRHPAGASPPPWTLGDYLAFAESKGYRGAWPWSFSGTDGYGPLPAEDLLQFAVQHPELVNHRVKAGDG
jgi:hypothetical protein